MLTNPDPQYLILKQLWRDYAQHKVGCNIFAGYKRSCDCGLLDASKKLDAVILQLIAWKEAIIDAAVIDWVYTKEHEENPRKAINDLLCHAQRLALDPAVSEDAANWRKLNQDLQDEIDRLKSLKRQELNNPTNPK